MTDELLSQQEHDAIRMAGDLFNLLCQIVEDGPTRDADLAELTTHIHALQKAVMGQAAARAYPELYRRLGATLMAVEVRTRLCSCGHRRNVHRERGPGACTDVIVVPGELPGHLATAFCPCTEYTPDPR